MDKSEQIKRLAQCIDKYDEYKIRAGQIAEKILHAWEFKPESISIYNNELCVFGKENYRCGSEYSYFSFPLEVLFYTDDELEEYNKQLIEALEQWKKEQEEIKKQKQEANDLALYEKLKVKFESNA